jgi:NADH-quinone oxidoreductase subunit M
MSTWPILTAITFLPLVGALFILVVRGEDQVAVRNMRWTALFTTLITFLLSLILWADFDPANKGFQFVEQYPWLGGAMTYHMGVDGISLPFVLLTAFLMPISILASFKVDRRVKEYMIAFLVLETLMIGVFCALDLGLFYLFFEGGLIPMFLIIGIWGGPQRVYASFKFFLYTLLGSVLMLLAIMAMFWHAGTSDIASILARPSFPAEMQTWLWLAFFASFAVKLPMWPVHTWLPDAHVEAPTAGSVILAAILLKLGTYGFIRVAIPILPEAAVEWAPYIGALAVIGIIYGALACLAQTDMKRLIAFSSVSHMGFVMLGIATLTDFGLNAAVMGMVAHGIITGMLFFLAGSLKDRYHTLEIRRLGGILVKAPRMGWILGFTAMASLGLPGLAGFWGEFPAILSAYDPGAGLSTVTFRVYMVIAALGTVFAAGYLLWLYQRTSFGVPTEEFEDEAIPDVQVPEWIAWVPMLVLILVIGIYPNVVFRVTDDQLTSVAQMVASAVGG